MSDSVIPSRLLVNHYAFR